MTILSVRNDNLVILLIIIYFSVFCVEFILASLLTCDESMESFTYTKCVFLVFPEGHYKKEINLKNPLGRKGKFAKVMDFTLASLWSGDRSSFSPSALREIMADTNDQFSTRGQQDAQEAMACIMDNLHEVFCLLRS